MVKGIGGAITQSLLNSVIKIPQNNLRSFLDNNIYNIHFVLTHPDDELAILPTVEKAIKSENVNANFTLTTNGSQGYESKIHISTPTREDFSKRRVEELNDSLSRVGYSNATINAILDERQIYEAMIKGENFETLHNLYNKFVTHMVNVIDNEKPDVIFVNDFSGGHMIHDLSNALTCVAVNESSRPYTAVAEYWQPYLQGDLDQNTIEERIISYLNNEESNIDNLVQVVGELSRNNEGRILIPGDRFGRSPLDIAPLGIRKGVGAYSLTQVLSTEKHRKKVYGSQEKSLDRLKALTMLSKRIVRPRFRRVDLDTINHTKRPEKVILYEVANIWRKRGLERGLEFNDFATSLNSYPLYQRFRQDREYPHTKSI